MAKKTVRKGKRATKRRSNLKRFSLVALHNQLDKVVRRLGKANTKSANELRDMVAKLHGDTACGQNMVLDLS